MRVHKHVMSTISATVEAVLPAMGLAYVLGDDHIERAVTKSTEGLGLETLHPGDRVSLKVERYNRFAVVREYAAIA
jgi:hypothetical protein